MIKARGNKDGLGLRLKRIINDYKMRGKRDRKTLLRQ